jgi:phosphatidylglycerol lysyltransferase
MVSASQRRLYKDVGCKSFKIGASAVVDIKKFNGETARNKWWRWVLNKTCKQGWSYELVTPPYNSHLIHELRHVSDAWLQRQNHQERGFALGYFDVGYLQNCRLHLLRHDGRLIAFTNELPSFNNNRTATIDLMRFLPDYSHAMPALLAQTIQRLNEEGVKKQFDLGFVPLASPSARTEQIIRQLGQSVAGGTVSARGLEQFKNKFAPTWTHNYIAFDGDWIDLVSISRQVDTLLKP